MFSSKVVLPNHALHPTPGSQPDLPPLACDRSFSGQPTRGIRALPGAGERWSLGSDFSSVEHASLQVPWPRTR
jgi:hypothetical protein